MKKLKKIIAALVILCFSLNNISYASETSSFKLAVPTSFSGFKGKEFRNAAQIQLGIRAALKDMASLGPSSLTALGQRQFAEKTVFTHKVSGTIYFDKAIQCSLPDGYLVRAKTARGVTYYSLISGRKNEKGYDVSVVPERVLCEALKKGAVKFTHESISQKDKAIIDMYLEHEQSTENNVAIDDWIREKMERGDYAVDNLTPENSIFYKNAMHESPLNGSYTELVKYIIGKLMAIGVKPDNCAGIISVLISKPLVTIPYDSDEELPEITIGSQKIKVKAHSSPFAIYVFVDRHEDPETINLAIRDKLIHETGAFCGLGVTLKNGKVWNELDEAIEALEAGKTIAISEELKNISPVNLLGLELRNDYAAGDIVKKKSIFKRATTILLAGLIVGGSYVFYDTVIKEKPEQETHRLLSSYVHDPAYRYEYNSITNRIETLREPAVSALVKELEGTDVKMRHTAFYMLENLYEKGVNIEKAVPYLIVARYDGDLFIKAHAFSLLARMENPIVIDEMIKGFPSLEAEYGDDNHFAAKEAKKEIIKTAGKLRDKRTIDPLIGILKGLHGNDLTVAAAEAIKNMPEDPRVIPALVAAAKRTSYSAPTPTDVTDRLFLINEAVAEALLEIGEPAVMPMTEEMRRLMSKKHRFFEDDMAVRCFIKILTKMKDKSKATVETLIMVLDSGKRLTYEQELSAFALGEIGSPISLPFLEKALYDKEESYYIKRFQCVVREAIEKIKKAQEEKTTPAKPRTEKITDALWNASLGTISRERAEEQLFQLAPEAGKSPEERGHTYDAWLAMAGSIITSLGLKAKEKHGKPDDEDIRLIAARIKEAGMEVFVPKSQFPGNTIAKYKSAMESIGSKLRIYQNIEDLQRMVTNPAKSIIMTTDIPESDAALLQSLKASVPPLRLMNFAKMEDLGKMLPSEVDNYQADILSILLVARIITPEDFQDKGSPTYRMLAHLLKDYMPEGMAVENYIEDIVTNAVKLIKTILRALPITTYKAMRQSVEVLWSA